MAKEAVMQVCQSCDKRSACRVPPDFARFERVYQFLLAHDGPEFLRQRLRVFLHINHCIAEGEFDLIHNLIDEHLDERMPPGLHVNEWGIPDDIREKMLALRREKPAK
jgi:hypothetical protein